MAVYVKTDAEATGGKHEAKVARCYCGTTYGSAYAKPRGGVKPTWSGEVQRPGLFVELPQHQGIVVRFKGVRYAVIGSQLYELGKALSPAEGRTVLREMREAVETVDAAPPAREPEPPAPRRPAPFDVDNVEDAAQAILGGATVGEEVAAERRRRSGAENRIVDEAVTS